MKIKKTIFMISIFILILPAAIMKNSLTRVNNFDYFSTIRRNYCIYQFMTVALYFYPKWTDRSYQLINVAETIYDEGVLKYKISMQEWMILIHCESEFYPDDFSTKGAIGMFQVMTNTAKIVCSLIGEKYSLKRLKKDPVYNARIGMRHYYSCKLNFGGSVLTTATVYNYNRVEKSYFRYIRKKEKNLKLAIYKILNKKT